VSIFSFKINRLSPFYIVPSPTIEISIEDRRRGGRRRGEEEDRREERRG